jgi:hypothetical protein
LNIFLDGNLYYDWGNGARENKKIDFSDSDNGN